MNQILFENNKNKKNLVLSNSKVNNKKTVFFKFQFVFCSITAFCVLSYYSYILYENNKKEELSKKLLNNFNVITLFNDADYSAMQTTNENMYIAEDTNFSVIGLIEIKKIQINYPIISSYNNDLLKIAPCRFFGPMPNEIGNMCVAGHNYNSYKFFSKLKNLSIGDIISIYDLSR